jgi:hypothetical protein
MLSEGLLGPWFSCTKLASIQVVKIVSKDTHFWAIHHHHHQLGTNGSERIICSLNHKTGIVHIGKLDDPMIIPPPSSPVIVCSCTPYSPKILPNVKAGKAELSPKNSIFHHDYDDNAKQK